MTYKLFHEQKYKDKIIVKAAAGVIQIDKHAKQEYYKLIQFEEAMR
jgi:hypothetical protein